MASQRKLSSLWGTFVSDGDDGLSFFGEQVNFFWFGRVSKSVLSLFLLALNFLNLPNSFFALRIFNSVIAANFTVRCIVERKE